jgi:hypothetical protein
LFLAPGGEDIPHGAHECAARKQGVLPLFQVYLTAVVLARGDVFLAGLVNGCFMQRAGEQAQGQERLWREEAHVLRDVGDSQPIEKGENKAVEDGQCPGSTALADLTGILTRGHITALVQFVLNGIITNDKFCLSQMRYLPKKPARKGFSEERQYPSETTSHFGCPKAENHETTTVEHSTFEQRHS